MLGDVSDLRDGLEALEDQFYLPAQAVGFQHLTGGGIGFRQGGEQEHILRVFAGLWSVDRLALLLLAGKAALGLLDGLPALADSADPALYPYIARAYPYGPAGELACLAQAGKALEQREGVTFFIEQGQNIGVEANTDIGLCRT